MSRRCCHRFAVVVCLLVLALVAGTATAQTKQGIAWAEAPDHAGMSEMQATRPAVIGLAPPLSSLPLSSEKGAYGLSLGGTVAFQVSGTQARLTADSVSNSNSTRTSGTLRLALWMAQGGYRTTGYRTAVYQIGYLLPNHFFSNLDSGWVAFGTPPSGCYYVSMLLEEWNGSAWVYVDYRDFDDRVAIGTGSCGGGGGSCTPDNRTACMLNNRFRVTVRFRSGFDNNPVDTDAFLKPVSGFADPNFETSFFYFNSVNNIEMMVKMLDQGNVDAQGHPTVAVLFGVATPLRIQVTIYDTVRATTKTYTSTFNSMQGVTDFTAFVK